MYPDRKLAARLGREALEILERGTYVAPSGATVSIAEALAAARAATRSLPPDAALPTPPAPPARAARATAVEVTGESTLAAARRIAREGGRPVALNFASARHPGGGFLSGARAQEESLARSSGLYACLRGDAMYAHHEATRDPMYTAWAIWSPDVPVFRDDTGALLERPYGCAFITCPAVNARVVLERDPARRPAIRDAMRARTRRVLAVAAAEGADELVLGAWGCGVFGNDPAEVAELFAEALAAEHAGRFRRVVFAILDSSPEQRFAGPFRARFG